MKEGTVALVNMLQADGSYKLRPVLLLKQLPKYNDFLVCGISTQIHQYLAGLDEIIDSNTPLFKETGLQKTSVIRLTFLAVISKDKIPGSIGKIPGSLHAALLKRLADFLISSGESIS